MSAYMRKSAAPVALACAFAVAPAPAPAAEIPQVEQVLADAAVWSLTPDAAAARWEPFGFEWTEKTRTDLRWYEPLQIHVQQGRTLTNAAGRLPAVQVLGERPVEVLFKFKDSALLGISALFYSRGDSGDTPMTNFVALTRTLTARLDAWAGSKGIAQRGDNRGEGAILDRMIWTRASARLDLEWSYTRTGPNAWRPEFIRLRGVKYDPAQQAQLMGGRAAAGPAPGGASDGMAGAMQMKKRLEVRDNGDRVLSVPMVDQGPKGYCVAAVLERVARFYGRDFDQHEAAQLANTSAEGGTTSERLVDGLRKMAGLMKMRCTGRTDMDEKTSFLDKKRRINLLVPKDLADTLKDYNREAKKEGKPEFDIWASYAAGDIGDLYKKFDRDILRKVRLADRTAVERFHRDVFKSIDAGAPVVWSVLVGLVPEAKIPADAELTGHMRMIIGYNLKTKEILYTDSWGPGHEEKRMSMDDAWVINKGYFVVTPQNVRL